MRPAVRVEGLGKKYVIGHQTDRAQYSTLRDEMARGLRGLVRSAKTVARGGALVVGDELEEFWALQDIDFEVAAGEVVGIIGRNGAGKSTLLKVLSRITDPTRGRVELNGRVASLLEVGTGFHPELTGRENIYLNGAILGMSRAEIRRKFDEIVAFSEVERFLDTPVKRYSSGMYVRLAFAVAAHLEPEILIVDEVLAVGDAKFQEKCLGKMQDIGSEGRTVLFVSHNMAAIKRLSSRAALLSRGRLVTGGPVDDVVSYYLEQDGPEGLNTPDAIARTIASFPPDPACRLINIRIEQDGVFPVRVRSSMPLEIIFKYEVLQETFGFHAFFRLLDSEGGVIFESIDTAEAESVPTIYPGVYESRALIPANIFAPRRYELELGLAIAHRRYCAPELIRVKFDVDLTGKVNQALPGYASPGKLLPAISWSIEKAC